MGVATQKPELRKCIDVEISANCLAVYLGASTDLMKVLPRACGRADLSELEPRDMAIWKREVAEPSEF